MLPTAYEELPMAGSTGLSMDMDKRGHSEGEYGHTRGGGVVKNEGILTAYMSHCRGDAYRTACLPHFGRIPPSQLAQAQGLHWDAWSFGATLFALAFGQAPVALTASSDDTSDHQSPSGVTGDEQRATVRTTDGSSAGKKGVNKAVDHAPATAATLLLRLMTLTPLLSENLTTNGGNTDDAGDATGGGLLLPEQRSTLQRLSALKGCYQHILSIHPVNTHPIH